MAGDLRSRRKRGSRRPSPPTGEAFERSEGLLKELDIRPRALFEEFLDIARRDIQVYFSERQAFVAVSCPACGSEQSRFAFSKHEFSYRSCEVCRSLYVSPRPTEEMIAKYYRESASSRFWAERFFPETADTRREQIFRPRAKMLAEVIKREGAPTPVTLVDVGAGFGLFLEETRQTGSCAEIVAVEPSPDLAAACRAKGFYVFEQPVETIPPGTIQASVASCFEVFEHMFGPARFVASMAEQLRPGGLLVFTTLTISGFDLLVLGHKSKSISPPHHINFVSVEGIRRLMERVGLEVVEICTPGKLDVDILRNMLVEDSGLELPAFFEYMLRCRGQDTWDAFQAFLQAHALSSHLQVVARKAGTA